MTIEEIMNLSVKDFQKYLSENIMYGFIGTNGKRYTDMQEIGVNFQEQYKLLPWEQLLENKLAMCWGYVEIERAYFEKHKIPYKTIFMDYYVRDANKGSHAFLIYEENGKYIWFESCYVRGLHEYDSEEELICNVKDIYVYNEGPLEHIEQLKMFEYTKPPVGVTPIKYGTHVSNGKQIDTLYYNKETVDNKRI